MNRRNSALAGALLLASVLAALFVLRQTSHRPIRIGLVGTFQGEQSRYAADVLNGAALALEFCNDAGGIDHRRVELLIRDDGGAPAAAAAAIKELALEEVWATLGPTLPKTLPAASTAAQESRHLVLCPLPSQWSGGEAGFLICTRPSRLRVIEQIGRYLRVSKGLRRPVVICEPRMIAPATPADIQKAMLTAGCDVVGVWALETSRPDGAIVEAIAGSAADSVVLLTESANGGLLLQQMRQANLTLPAIAGEWAASSEMLAYGAAASEDLTLLLSCNLSDEGDRIREFSSRYQSRFGGPPTHAAVHGYEATWMLLRCISQSSKPEELRNVLLARGSFDGLQSAILVGNTGQVRRELIVAQVKQGAIRALE